MKQTFFPILLIACVTFSCDKAKNLADKARSAVETELAKNVGESGDTKADPELQKLVDQTPEGAIFRKDLPFPDKVEVKATRIHELSIRNFATSAIDTQASVVKGTQTTVTKVGRFGPEVRYTLEESTFAEPVIEDEKEEKKPVVRQLAPPSKPRTFKKSGSAWKSDDSDGFRSAALSKQLSPVFDQLLVDNALAPRPLWFGKKRFKIGDKITISGSSLPMLASGNAKGVFNLTLQSFEAVKGHPCGVFAVTGDYSRKQFPDFEGNLTDEEVTIQSGKLWLSLIYPLVLREEADTIQSTRSGGQGNAANRSQGTVKVSVVREWKQTAP